MPSRGQQLGKLLNRSGDIVPASLPPKIETFSQSVTNTGKVETAALPTAIADLETIGQTLSGGEIAPSSIKSNTLTQTFSENQAVAFNMADSIDAVSPIVSVFKEVPQQGFSSKGQWDVNANATNYEFFDEKPYSTYASSTLTPSAIGDGTFNSSNPISRRHIPASTAATTYATYGAEFSGGMFGLGLYDWGGALLSDDGTKFWMVAKNKGTNSDEAHIYAWTLSTPFRVDTAAAVGSTAIKVITEMSNITALLFNNDGTKIVCANGSNFYQFDLSTAYDLSTMGSGTESNWRIDLQRDPLYIDWSGSGDKLIITEAWTSGGASTRVRVFDLNTPYDITTMANLPVGTTTSFDSTNPYYSIYSSNTYQKGWKISQDGLKFYAIDAVNGRTLTKELPSAWVMKTGSVTTGDQGGLGDGNNWLTATEDNYDLITGNYYHLSWTQNGSAIILFNGAKAPNYLDIISLPVTQVFLSTDVGKKVVGNSGSAIITSTAGAYQSVTPFADTSAISSWQLFGAQGKSDGSGITLAGFSSDFDISSAGSELYNSLDTYLTGDNIRFSNDGTRLFLVGNNGSNGQVFRFDLNTAYDLNSINTNGGSNNSGSFSFGAVDVTFNSDGSLMYVLSGGNIYKYTATNNAFTGSGLSVTLSNTANISSIGVDNYSLEFSSDGTKLYIGQFLSNFGGVRQLNLTTAWDPAAGFTDAYSYTITEDTIAANKALPWAIRFIDNGSKMLVLGGRNDEIYQYTLSTAWDLSTASYSNKKYSNSSISDFKGFDLSADTSMMFTFERNNNQNYYRSFNISDTTNIVLPYSTYSPALTNSSTGQINSSSWLDINSMTADETKNDGDIFYAVSTDNRASWSVAKGSDGVRKIAKNNSGTWQYNNHAGTNNPWQYNSAAASGNTLTISSAFNYGSWLSGGGTHNSANIKFSPDGTKIFWAPGGGNSDGDDIYTANLSTAWDLSTASQGPVYTEYSSSGYGQASFAFNSDGTKLYTVVRHSTSSANRRIRQWSLSTAYDVSTSSYVGQTSSSTPISNVGIRGIYVSSDESYFITNHQDTGRDYIKKWNLATAGDITSSLSGETAVDVTTYTNWSAPAVGLFYATAPDFFDNGNKMIMLNHGGGGSNTNDVYLIELSTAYDITSGTVIGKFTSATGAESNGVGVKPDGSKLYALDGTGGIVEFNTGSVNFETSETWVNGTNNNEHATLQQALTSQAFNRMNKAQLDAVADGYHFSQDSADTLDLMIAPYAASGTSPISDGVTINYDAEALIREAIPGTDYIAEFPNPTTLNITAVGAANLKIRAQ